MAFDGTVVIHTSTSASLMLSDKNDKSTLQEGISILAKVSPKLMSILGNVLTPTDKEASALDIIFDATNLYSVVLAGDT